jgi:hypothetical protein
VPTTAAATLVCVAASMALRSSASASASASTPMARNGTGFRPLMVSGDGKGRETRRGASARLVRELACDRDGVTRGFRVMQGRDG